MSDEKDKRPGAEKSSEQDPPRRDFLTKVAAGGIGVAVGAVPLAIGGYVALDPLNETSAAQWIQVATLDEVPEDGTPVRKQVIADQWDKWTFAPDQPIGSVFLVRLDSAKPPTAFNTTCPHAGCSIELRGEIFVCPCHNSTFQLDGSMHRPEENPSPRPMDELPCEIRDGNEVWVEYRNFVVGKAEKKAKA